MRERTQHLNQKPLKGGIKLVCLSPMKTRKRKELGEGRPQNKNNSFLGYFHEPGIVLRDFFLKYAFFSFNP